MHHIHFKLIPGEQLEHTHPRGTENGLDWNSRGTLLKWEDYLVMSALRKLPRVTGRMLYRGVRGEVSLDKDHYHKGNVVTWSALSSTTPDMETTKTFLAKGAKGGEATGTLSIIDKGWGYDIQPYSLFPDEEEILLEPERARITCTRHHSQSSTSRCWTRRCQSQRCLGGGVWCR